MGEIKVGTASWTDKTLLASGWYPADADTPEKRLAYYAKQFPLVEVDATYYAPPAEQTAALWAQRTPPEFTFNIKAFSLLTGHPTRVVVDLQGPAAGDRQEERLPGRPADRRRTRRSGPGSCPRWTRWSRPASWARCCSSSRRGSRIRRSNKQYLLEVAERCAPLRAGVEFRHASWFEGDNRDETLEFLRQHQLPYVCVDMPQGHKSSIPPVLAATADLAVVRFHGHSDKWTSKDIYEKFGYRVLGARAGRLGAEAASCSPRTPPRRTC